jgi:tripartite-type tricarboxylate transporter receptor subunit TctC
MLSFNARRHIISGAVGAALGAFIATVPGTAAAQAWPTAKPVRIVVPFPAGSSTDQVARTIGQAMSQAIGQQVIVDNKAGADGVIAAQEVLRAPPDGYTLFLATNSPLATAVLTKLKPPYDPVADFTPITDVGRYTFFFALHPSVPAKNAAEFVAHAKANPGKLNYATGNTTGIVATALFASLAGIQMTHVPYKGEPQALTDLLGGQVQMMTVSSGTSLGHFREGKLRPFAVMLDRRSPALPEVPTIHEVGFDKFKLTSWAALFAPAKMPRDLVERVNKEFITAMNRPEVKVTLEKAAFNANPSTPEALGQFLKDQLLAYKSALDLAGVKPE